MIVYDKEVVQIHNEQRYISKFAGMAIARFVLMLLLFFLFFCMHQIPVYLCTFGCFFPWIFSNILANRSKKDRVLLEHVAERYYYTKARYRAEKYTSNCLFFFLVVWQLSLNRTTSYSAILQLAPAFLLLIFLLTRFVATFIIRHNISSYYMSLESLDNEEHENGYL